ncbi:hypothetical protein AGMMS49957_13470 [Synergistales bacterium]|nr:hypothetical protein AGMMS49957_13470 [Synergistales bacterium]
MSKTSRRAGFTFAEVLISLIVLSVIYASSLFSANSFGGANPEKEAKSLAQWFSGLVAKANLSKRSFDLICPNGAKTNVIRVEWHFPTETEKYTAVFNCLFNRYESVGYRSRYTPQWNSLTPAATIKVSAPGVRDHYVIISGTARARTNKSP